MNNLKEPERESKNILDQVVLGEISGKNAAIHAYDGIIWKIRSGFLTIVFAGWAIILKSMTDGTVSGHNAMFLVNSLLLVSIAIALGAWVVDRNYVKRKFRVIKALNQLIVALDQAKGDPDKVPSDLLMVSGDDGDRDCRCKGYTQACYAGLGVYMVPPIPLAVITFWSWKWLSV